MINSDMRVYDFFTLGEQNEYGQRVMPDKPTGTVKMDINITSQSIQDNILYSGAKYIGLTFEDISDKNIIQYGDKKLKVLYINPKGRYKQVFMADYE